MAVSRGCPPVPMKTGKPIFADHPDFISFHQQRSAFSALSAYCKVIFKKAVSHRDGIRFFLPITHESRVCISQPDFLVHDPDHWKKERSQCIIANQEYTILPFVTLYWVPGAAFRVFSQDQASAPTVM
jgi:hypothetical protein